MRSFLSLTTGLSLALIVAGCSLSDPSLMPRGYSSYSKEYKSVDGAKARDIGYDYSNEKNNAVLDSMRVPAASLVEMLDKKLNFSIDNIYLKTPANTAFYNSFDYLIRDELLKKGYMLTITPENAVTIDFVAKHTPSNCSVETHDDTTHTAYLALAIDVVNKVPNDLVAGFYEIPIYDYKDAGHVKIDISTCPR